MLAKLENQRDFKEELRECRNRQDDRIDQLFKEAIERISVLISFHSLIAVGMFSWLISQSMICVLICIFSMILLNAYCTSALRERNRMRIIRKMQKRFREMELRDKEKIVQLTDIKKED